MHLLRHRLYFVWFIEDILCIWGIGGKSGGDVIKSLIFEVL